MVGCVILVHGVLVSTPCALAYLAAASVAITKDFLMAVMFLLFTLGLLGAYVAEFPVFPTLYQNEILHKAAVSSLLGMGIGMVIGLAIAGGRRNRRNCSNFNTSKVSADMGSNVTAGISVDGFSCI